MKIQCLKLMRKYQVNEIIGIEIANYLRGMISKCQFRS